MMDGQTPARFKEQFVSTPEMKICQEKNVTLFRACARLDASTYLRLKFL